MLCTFCAVIPLVAASGAALADPGHSTIAATIAEWAHLVLSPDHLLGMIAAVVLGIGLAIVAAVRQLHKERRDDSR